MLRFSVLLIALPLLAQQDLHLTYTSPIDNTAQPYRLYIPKSHPTPAPLVIAMHGTGGNENTLFDDPAYQHITLKQAAEKLGVIVVSPHGRGITEYRGIGEHDAALRADVCRRLAWLGVAIDPTLNAQATRDQEMAIHCAESAVEVWVMPTDEGLVVAREAARLVQS